MFGGTRRQEDIVKVGPPGILKYILDHVLGQVDRGSEVERGEVKQGPCYVHVEGFGPGNRVV